MEVTNLGYKVDLRGAKDAAGNSGPILQISFRGNVKHEGKEYELFCSCAPINTVLNIGYCINRKSLQLVKVHTHIYTIVDGKHQRADKTVYEAAKVDLYPYMLENMKESFIFGDLDSVNVSE